MSENEVPDEERLQQLQHDIDAARSRAEDADIVVEPDEHRFYESGDQDDDLDDQTIAPPG